MTGNNEVKAKKSTNVICPTRYKNYNLKNFKFEIEVYC